MKQAKILHNPNAGKQQHSKKDIVSLIKAGGFDCGYSSTKDNGWKKVHRDTDFYVVAGGDGTVRIVALKLIHKKPKKRLPVLLLPLGTANNIAKSLGIAGHLEEIVKNVGKKHIKKFDVGRIGGLKKETIFLESFGYGVFPELMARMKEKPEREDATPEENLQAALELLHHIIQTFPAIPFTISVDGMVHSEKYILAEVMNTSSLGPNVNLSPHSDPGDGELEIIVVSERQREEFASYISYKLSGIEKTFTPTIMKGRNISITSPPGKIHADDELMIVKKIKTVSVTPMPGMIEFFVQ